MDNTFLESFLKMYPKFVVIEALRYGLTAGLFFLIVWKILGRRLRHRRIFSREPAPRQMRREVAYSLRSGLIFALVAFGIYWGALHKWFDVYSPNTSIPWTLSALRFIVMVIGHDTYFYWTHRWMHHPRLFKLLHQAHHKSVITTPWTAYSFSVGEALVQALYVPIFIWFFGPHFVTSFIFMLYMVVMNALGHLGFELFPNSFLKRGRTNWYNTSTHHAIHHQSFHYNYGLYFRHWDRWMGTEAPGYPEMFEQITSRPSSNDFPPTTGDGEKAAS